VGGTLEAGYWGAYRNFYRLGSILQSAWVQNGLLERLRHTAYVVGWKKLEPLWDWVIRSQDVNQLLPVLESVLAGFGSHQPEPSTDKPHQDLALEFPQERYAWVANATHAYIS
jgi:hypothetical protein